MDVRRRYQNVINKNVRHSFLFSKSRSSYSPVVVRMIPGHHLLIKLNPPLQTLSGCLVSIPLIYLCIVIRNNEKCMRLEIKKYKHISKTKQTAGRG